MAAHAEISRALDRRGKTYSTATAGVTTLTAGNTNFSHQELHELLYAAESQGYEVVLTAGAVKIRPLNSAL